ncbi:MAG TPA: DNA polymerase III subunit delta [Clostridiales bacterium]|nr:DNA polymerase III subunit delta [Clostridiales bacterium]
MKYNALATHLKTKQYAPCYLIQGEDKWLVNSAIVMLCGIVSNPLLNCGIFQENEHEDNIINALKVMPWDSDYRVVVVTEFTTTRPVVNSGGKNTGKPILEYLKDPNPSSVLVMVSNGSEFFSKLKAYAQIIDCSKLENFELAQYIKDRCQDRIEKAAIDTLIAYCSSDMGRINTELDKILSYKENEPITEQDVIELAIKDDDYKIYELTNCLADKNPDQAFKIWNSLSYGADNVYLVNSVYNYFRKLLYTAVNKNQPELYKKLNVNQYAFRYLERNSKKFGAQKLKKICDMLQLMDYYIKSGKIDKQAAGDKVILNIINI